jgi:hypothetical protein
MKGFTNNIHGRPKGVPNKITSELRSMLNDFVTEQWETIKQDFGRLESKERLIYYEKLLQYCLPKNGKAGLDSEEEKVELPLFETVLCYELDLEKVQYPELKEMIEKSEVFMSSRLGASVRIELPDNYRQYEAK